MNMVEHRKPPLFPKDFGGVAGSPKAYLSFLSHRGQIPAHSYDGSPNKAILWNNLIFMSDNNESDVCSKTILNVPSLDRFSSYIYMLPLLQFFLFSFTPFTPFF